MKEKEAAAAAENELNSTPSTLENRFVVCEARDKFATLVAFLRNRFADEVRLFGNPFLFSGLATCI